MIQFLGEGKLPEDPGQAKKLVVQEPQFSLIDNILYCVDHEHDNKKTVAVTKHLREKLIRETDRGVQGGHFSGCKVYKALRGLWWWQGMHSDVLAFRRKCVTGGGYQHRPPLRSIPVERPFQNLEKTSWTFHACNVAISMLLCSRTS